MGDDFGDMVRRARERQGLSMSRLGSMVGRSRSAVRAWERGESTPDSPAVVVALSAVLDLDQDGLFAAAGIPPLERGARPTVEEALATLQVDQVDLPATGPASDPPASPAAREPSAGQAPKLSDLPRAPSAIPVPPTTKQATSYLEDRSERTRYQLRVLATVVAVTVLVLVLVWAFGEFREAIGAVWDSLRGEPSSASSPAVTPGS